MIIHEVIDRLSGADLGLTVKGSADLVKAQADQLRDSVFVMALDESAANNSLMTGVRQQVTLGIGVIIALGNRRDRRGQGAQDEINDRREDVRRLLLGWQPDSADDVMTYRGGRLLNIQDAVVWWQDEYSTQYMITGGL